MSDAPATIRRTTMKAIVHERYGRPDVLALREVPVPAPVTGNPVPTNRQRIAGAIGTRMPP